MGHSSLLFITITVSFFSLGSLVQTSHTHDNSSSVQITRGTGKNNTATDSLASEVLFHSVSSSDSVEGIGHNVDSEPSQKLISKTVSPKGRKRPSTENRSGSGITLTTTPALTLHHLRAHDQGADTANTSVTAHTHSSVLISEVALLEGSHITTEEQLKESHISVVNDYSLDGRDSPELPVQTNVFTSVTNQNLSVPRGPCVLGLRPCVVLKNFNGTNLLWDDMSRTLAFAWELHVFGSASLFIMMAVLAVLGIAGACTLPHPLCDAMTLANSLLLTGGTLRGVLLLLDPYGTRQILSRATLAALHNVPLQLLLWAQVALALVTLRGLKLLLFPLKLQCPWVVGGLAILHCTPLLVADLYSSTLSPAVPLLLQTFSLCLGLPFCMGILIKSLSHLQPFLRSSVPQWVPSQWIEKRAKRVTAVCAFLGVLCCSLQMYSLLWLYGLLGNWRRFGWGWWLSQFWARILELAWGFSLIVLGSWIFWMPSRCDSSGDHGQGRSEVSKGVEEKSLWGRVLAIVRKGPLKKSEKNWGENLMPNNWAKYKMTRAGISNDVMYPYDDQPSTITQEYNLVSNSSSDSQAALLWQKVGERECILSLIEFDMRPPSPINLRRSIDKALYHGQLVKGGLFTPPPPSWTHTAVTDTSDGDGGTTTFPPAYVGYGWMLDTESISASLDHFQAKEPIQSPSATAEYNGSIGSPTTVHKGGDLNSALSAVMHQHDWSDDDITDL